MNAITKGISPFYPGQPVPVELFVGRQKEIEKISRAVKQVEHGKPQALFLTGEYGIGKSSLAGFMRSYAEKENHLFGIHVFLGGATTIEDVAIKTVEAVLKTPAYEPTLMGKVRNALSKYIGKQELFGVQINFEALKADSPNISHGYLPFLRELLERLKDEGIKGIMLVLDEINGISSNPTFAHFIKGLVDENALSPHPLPLMLMLCGVEERRREMIQHHQPVERIFDIVEINPMANAEMKDFFSKAFRSQNIKINKNALEQLCHYSAGFPKIMHIVGDATFWIDQDGIIDDDDALKGIILAAEDIGRKFVDQQVLRALRSKDYHSIMEKMGKSPFDLSFQKTDIEKGLSYPEKKKFNNFLQRLKKLKVLRSGDIHGEYVFNSRLVRLYILLNAIKKDTPH
ncbi:MAG: ATP-binding protein [Nitrospiraceae bacterium]|nr:MAG: ATP-binding protein [Nitrospiraceae bacterium]